MVTIMVGASDGLHHDDGTVELAGSEVTALSADGERLWALVDGSVRRRGPDGAWETVVDVVEPAPRCLLATGRGVLVGTAGAHLLRVAGDVADRVAGNGADRVAGDGADMIAGDGANMIAGDGADMIAGDGAERLASFDTAEGRADWYTPWGGPPDTRSMVEDADGTVFVSVHVGGVLRSDDGGATWQPTVDIHTDVHQIDVERRTGRLVAATGAAGLLVSPDGGRTWQEHRDGLHATYLRAVTSAHDSLLLSASTGPGGDRSAVYRRALGGDGAFERCRTGLPEWFDDNVDTGWLAGAGSVAALAAPDGTVYRSDDGGGSWAPVLDGVTGPNWVALLA